MSPRTSRKAPPTPLDNFYNVGLAAVRLGLKTQKEHDAGSSKGERWLREGANRPEDGSKGEMFPHRRMGRELQFSESDLAYIAAMHFNAPTQGARRGSRKRVASRPTGTRVATQAATEPAQLANVA